MTTITKVIPTAPTAPSRQDPATFSDRSDAFVGYIESLDTELNTWAGQVNTVAGEVDANAATALEQAGIATTQAGIATDKTTEVVSAGTTQIGLVQAEGSTHIGLVEAEGATQIGLVQAEGSTQIGLVEAEGATQIGLAQDQVILATAQADLAEAASAQALLTTGVTIYNAATTYGAGDTVYDSDNAYKAYISQQDNNTNHNPDTDNGTWWRIIIPDNATQSEMESGTVADPRMVSPAGVKQAIIALSPMDKLIRSSRTSNAALSLADHGTLIDITSGTFTQTFASAATLGNGWWCYIRNSGSGDITLDPDSSQTIDGLSSFVMYPGEARIIQCTGTAFYSLVLCGFYRVFTASATFVVPPGYTVFGTHLWGGGGGGAGGHASGSIGYGGGGGGGGGFITLESMRLTPGATISVTVGAGGNAGSGGNSSFGTNGGTGGNSSFGAFASAYGGSGGTSASDPQGGYGGGIGPSLRHACVLTAVISGTTLGPLLDGDMGSGFCGAKKSRYKAYISSSPNVWDYVGASEYGGSGGGAGGSAPLATYGAGPGGRSLYGATGGGGGGGFGGSSSIEDGAAGGGVLSMAQMAPIYFLGGGAAAGTAGSILTSMYGSGGGGGGGSSSFYTTGQNGGAGASPGGGGGGGGGAQVLGGAGGAGGAGQVKIWGKI